MTVTATLGQAGGGVSGTLALTGEAGAQSFTVAGATRGGRARLTGVVGARRLLWKGRWSAERQAWRGRVRVREVRYTMRGRLTLARGAGPGGTCGDAFFAQELMPTVFGPICAQCHTAGGVAQGTRLRVVAGDPSTTARSALILVDVTNPDQSVLVRKPRGELPHGGGQRIVPGSAEDQAVLQWIALVATCGGGGGGGGGGATGDLYLDNCASCHGTDARGLDGRPDIHCSRSIHDVVRSGRSGPAGDMPAFPNLTDSEIATIQAFLIGLCPTSGVTGAELYASNCAACHGAEAIGTPEAPSVRCATRVADALGRGRGTAMPSFPEFADVEVTRLQGYLADLCTAAGRPGADLYAGNCAGCHGVTANGGRDGLGVRGPGIRCKGANDYQEKVSKGDGRMPPFPALVPADVTAIVDFVHAAYCPGGGAGGGGGD
jgi:mono/diheme cytochrome c family protein